MLLQGQAVVSGCLLERADLTQPRMFWLRPILISTPPLYPQVVGGEMPAGEERFARAVGPQKRFHTFDSFSVQKLRESESREVSSMTQKSSKCIDVRLPGKGILKSHGARPVHQIISMTKWIRQVVGELPLGEERLARTSHQP